MMRAPKSSWSPGGVATTCPRRRQKVRPWLLGVARNVAFDDFRSMMRWESHPAEQFEGVSRGADDEVIGAETERLVWSLPGSLSESDRELLLLVAWDGLSLRQTAAVIGHSYTTTKVRLHRARKRFETEFCRQQQSQTIDLTMHPQQKRAPDDSGSYDCPQAH